MHPYTTLSSLSVRKSFSRFVIARPFSREMPTRCSLSKRLIKFVWTLVYLVAAYLVSSLVSRALSALRRTSVNTHLKRHTKNKTVFSVSYDFLFWTKSGTIDVRERARSCIQKPCFSYIIFFQRKNCSLIIVCRRRGPLRVFSR